MLSRTTLRILGFGLFFVTSTIQPLAALAQAMETLPGQPLFSEEGFRPEHILDDGDIFEINGMNQARIQEFLDRRGTLGTIRIADIDGKEKPVAEIIWRVATSYKINPQYLLALLQKEQSLVEDRDPTQKQFDWATGYGVCDNCSKNDPAIQDFKGFASQLEWAAKQHREKYLLQILSRGKTIAGYAPGKETIIDGKRLIPRNQATAMLYSYTPHIAGNLNLWRIWKRWFGLTLPDGTIAQGRTSKQTYLIRFGEKRPFKSQSVVASLVDMDKVVVVDDSQLINYPQGKAIAFANYSLVQVNSKRYLIDGQKKRLILNQTVFERLGFNEDELIEANEEELEAYEKGKDVTLASAYPTGLLAKDTKGTFWYIEEEHRRLIPHQALVNLYFRSQPARLLTTKELAKFPVGDPYQLHSGELVQVGKQKAVYVIEQGTKRPIPSGEIFEEIGWDWKNVIALPESLLKQYPLGEPIDPHQDLASLTYTTALTH
jgi:hypothetical protein